jgi:acetoin utilization protein AcuC
VVPRAWTHLLAVVAGRPLDPRTPTPQEWRDHVRELLGRTAPQTMTDGVEPTYRDWSGGYDPDNWLDRSVLATREAAFPFLGLDPHL